MIVTAALNWWHERPEDLDVCVRGLGNVADRVVALDGAYRRYPEATIRSPESNLIAIREAAEAVNIECLIIQPDRLWAGQVEKRSHLLAAAGVGTDWIATLDADHVIKANRDEMRLVLRKSPQVDVFSVPYVTPRHPTRGMKQSAVGKWHVEQAIEPQYVPHLWRVLPGLRVEKFHWWYSAMKPLGRVWMWGGDASYPVNQQHQRIRRGYEIEHLTMFRTEEQIAFSRAFLNDRALVVEKTGQEDDRPDLPRPVYDSKLLYLVIVCIGDSITYGQHLEEPSKAWPFLVRAGMATNQGFVSRGVPGDTTRLGLERFPSDVQGPCPAAVIIQFGHNDANRWETDRGLPRVSLAAFKANLYEMIDRARRFGAVPYLCTLTPTLRPEPHPTDCARYDMVIRRVADEEGVRLIDVRSAFEAELDVRSLLLEDGLHLSVVGHQVYADAVQQVLDSEPLP